MNSTTIESKKGAGDTPELSLPVIGIPEEFLAHEAQLGNEEIFEHNWESKPERVIEGLLSTAAEYPESDIAVHMGHEIGLIEAVENPKQRVLEALQSFAQEQAEATQDEAWREVSHALESHQSKENSDKIAASVAEYLRTL